MPATPMFPAVNATPAEPAIAAAAPPSAAAAASESAPPASQRSLRPPMARQARRKRRKSRPPRWLPQSRRREIGRTKAKAPRPAPAPEAKTAAVKTAAAKPAKADARPSRPLRRRKSQSRAGQAKTGTSRQVSEPEDEVEKSSAPLIEHLIELRRRLIWSIGGFFVAFLVCFFVAKQLFNLLVVPFKWAVEWAHMDRQEGRADLHGAAGILLHAGQARDVRRHWSSPSR